MIVGRDIILDSSAIVALLVPRDQWHGAAIDVAPEMLRRCLTTEAVLTEVTHLIARGRHDPAEALEFLISLDIPIVAIHLPLHEACLALMRRYRNVPMDYADATLVALGDRLRITTAFTFDRRGFGQYRVGPDGAPFDIIPS